MGDTKMNTCTCKRSCRIKCNVWYTEHSHMAKNAVTIIIKLWWFMIILLTTHCWSLH